jgi:hypothetical protein
MPKCDTYDGEIYRSDFIANAVKAVQSDESSGIRSSDMAWLAMDQRRSSHSVDSFLEILTPLHVARFLEAVIGELGEVKVVDPFAISPIPIVCAASLLNVTDARAVIANTETKRDLEKLGYPKLSVEGPSVDGPLRFSEAIFDWAICTPPLGAKMWDRFVSSQQDGPDPKKKLVAKAGESVFGNGISTAQARMGELLPIALNLDRISTGFVIQLAESIFWSEPGAAWLAWLASRGYFPSAALSVSKGSNRVVVDTTIVAFTREQHPDLWVGRLESTSDAGQIARNFVRRTTKGPAEFGALVDINGFQSWGSFLASNRLESWARKRKIPLVTLGSIATEIGRFRASEDNEPPNTNNAIFIDDRVIRAVSAVPYRPTSTARPAVPQHYVQLDPASASAEFVVAWFASEMGTASLQARAVGSGQKRVTSSGIPQLLIPLPTIALQENYLRVQNRIQSVALAATEALDALSKAPTDSPEVLAQFHDEIEHDPLVAWMRRMPYPLAAILEVHLAETDTRERYERLLFFFEAFVEFGADVLLSILRRDEELWASSRTKLVQTIDGRARNPLRQTEFGGLVHVCFSASKILKSILQPKGSFEQDPDVLRHVTGISDKNFIQGLTNTDLWNACRAANTVRNTSTRAHGGDVPRETIEREMEQLLGLIDILRPITFEIFKKTEVVLPGAGRKQGGQRMYSDARRLMGPSHVFTGRPLHAQSLVDLEADRLVIVERDQEVVADALELTGLIRLEEQPRGNKNIAFFYNRASGNEHVFRCFQTDGQPSNEIFDPRLEALITDIDP